MLTKILINTFIKDKNNTSSPKVRGKYASLAGMTGILANILLFSVKLLIGVFSGAVAIIADALNNMTDAGSSVVTLVAFKLSNKRADKGHPMGHGRMEYISAFVVDCMIFLVGFELLKSSIEKIINPTLPDVSTVGLILLAAAICVKLWMFFFYGKIAKTISSSAIRAAALDSITDVAASSVVLITAIISKTTGLMLDGPAGLVVAVFILYTGVKAVKEAAELLIGAAPSPEFVEEIYSFVLRYKPDIMGLHDLMIHDYGPSNKVVTFHAEVAQDADIVRAHEIVDRMEKEMSEHFGCIVNVHMDPLAVNDERVDEMRSFVMSCVSEVDAGLSIHDFRMTDGDNHVNLIFDMVIPLDCKLEKETAVKLVTELIKKRKPHCSAVILAENPYI